MRPDLAQSRAPEPAAQLPTADKRPRDGVYARLSEHVYRDDFEEDDDVDTCEGWTVQKIWTGGRGFKAALYEHVDSKQLVVAYRGTKEWMTWVENFSGIYRNHVDSVHRELAFDVAAAAVKKAGKRKQLSFTGHSLGAFLAEVALFYCHTSCHYPNVSAVTFDGPGSQSALEALQGAPFRIDLSVLDITAYVSYPNAINTFQAHVGSVYQLDPLLDPSRYGVITGDLTETHSIGHLREQLACDDGPRHFMATWPIGNQRAVFHRLKSTQRDATGREVYHLDQSAEDEWTRSQFQLDYQGAYRALEDLSGTKVLDLRHLHPALRAFVLAFAAQLRYRAPEEWATQLADIESPEEKETLKLLLSTTVHHHTSYSGLNWLAVNHELPLDAHDFRERVSTYLASSPDALSRLMRYGDRPERAGIEIYQQVLKEGAVIAETGRVKADLVGYELTIPVASDEAYREYMAQLHQVNLDQGINIRQVAIPKGAEVKGTVKASMVAMKVGAGISPSTVATHSNAAALRQSGSPLHARQSAHDSRSAEEKDEVPSEESLLSSASLSSKKK